MKERVYYWHVIFFTLENPLVFPSLPLAATPHPGAGGVTTQFDT